MSKKDKTQTRYCWECGFSKPNMDTRYRTPSGAPIFYNCHYDQAELKRGLMDNTVACSKFKKRL